MSVSSFRNQYRQENLSNFVFNRGIQKFNFYDLYE